MALNLELTSSKEKSVLFDGEYGDDDLLESSITIDYSVSGTFSYSVSTIDNDSGNPQTNVTNVSPGTITIALSILKSHFTAGTTNFDGTVIVQVDDNNSSDTEQFSIDFSFIVTNNGTYVAAETFGLNTNGIAVSTELVRDSGIEEVDRIAYPLVETIGGTGPFEYTWVAADFDHFLIESTSDLDSANPVVNFKLVVADDIPEELFNPSGGKWTQTGIFNVSVRDTSNGDISVGQVSWSYTVTVQEENRGDDLIRESRIVPGRFRVRNPLNNFWYDLCYYEIYVFDKEYKQWIRMFPNKVLVRDGGNNDWLEIGCVTDTAYDDPCAAIGEGGDCNGASQDPLAGSGDGLGSGGSDYDEITGYPEGFDMPDSSLGGFGVKIAPKATGYDTPVGYLMQRPGLQSEESYDPTGLSPDEGAHGRFLSPNLNGASTFSRGAAVTETVYELPAQNGYYELLYAAYSSVSIDVYYVGQRVATTCGPVPAMTRGLLTFNVNIAAGLGERRIMIRVRGAEDVRWVYQVVGPKPAPVLQDFDNHDDADYSKISEFLYEENEMMQLQYIGTPMFPAPCHGTVGNFDQTYPWALSDRTDFQNWFEYYHYVGENGGPMVLDYSSWTSADYVEIWQNGVRIATSQDYQQAPGHIDFVYQPRDGVQDIMVRVHTENKGMGQDLSTWYYTLFCPDAIGHRRSPWTCGPDVVYSMGHPATEDNFDIDNGVLRGAFKIFMRACTAPTLVRVFSQNGDVIAATTGEGDFDVEAFNFNITTGEVYKDIYIRIETSIGQGWEYTVGCPVPLLDIILEPVDPSVEWTIDDVIVQDTEDYAELTISINKSQLIDRTIEWSTSDSTAYDQTDYCNNYGTVTIPAGQTSVTVQVDLAPCGEDSGPEVKAEWLTARITGVSDITTNDSDDAYAGILVGMIKRSDDPTGPEFPGYKNLGPTNDTVTTAGTNPELTGSAGNHLAVTRVNPNGLVRWRTTILSGQTAGSNTRVGEWLKVGDAFDTSKVGAEAFNTQQPDGLQNVSVKVEFEYSNGSILEETVTLTAQTPVDSGGGGFGGGCIASNTPLLVPNGAILARDVEVGMTLLGRSVVGMPNGDTEGWEEWKSESIEGEVTEVVVKRVVHDTYNKYFHINDDLRITTNHRIMVKVDSEWSWMYADDICVGDYLLGQDGEILVTSIEYVIAPLDVVTMDVEDIDNYFAGETPVVVHNVENENQKD